MSLFVPVENGLEGLQLSSKIHHRKQHCLHLSTLGYCMTRLTFAPRRNIACFTFTSLHLSSLSTISSLLDSRTWEWQWQATWQHPHHHPPIPLLQTTLFFRCMCRHNIATICCTYTTYLVWTWQITYNSQSLALLVNYHTCSCGIKLSTSSPIIILIRVTFCHPLVLHIMAQANLKACSDCVSACWFSTLATIIIIIIMIGTHTQQKYGSKCEWLYVQKKLP